MLSVSYDVYEKQTGSLTIRRVWSNVPVAPSLEHVPLLAAKVIGYIMAPYSFATSATATRLARNQLEIKIAAIAGTETD